MAEELEEKVIESEEEVEDVIEDDLGFDEEDGASGELSWKQKLILINCGVVAFLFSILLLFPYEELARIFSLFKNSLTISDFLFSSFTLL